MKELLIRFYACEEAQIWAKGKSWQEIYNTCHRGDWLLWLFARTMNRDNEDEFKLLTLAKAHCANTVRHLMKDKRSTDAIDGCFDYVEGRIDRQQLQQLAAAADDAADDAFAYAPNAAVYAAAYADYADYADYAAAYADYAAAYAADAASRFDAAREQNRLLTANLCRQYLPIDRWNIDVNLKWE